MVLLARTSTGSVLPLLVDASGNIIVSASQLTTTGGKIHVDANGNLYTLPDLITTTGGKYHIDANGDQYVVAKDNTALSPVGSLQQAQNLNLSAGSSTLNIYTIPASQRHLLTQVSMRYTGTVAGVLIRVQVYDGANTIVVLQQTGITSLQFYSAPCNVLMEAGWIAQVFVSGATLNDDILAEIALQRYL